MKKMFYIGSYPPPYGGVTIRNSQYKKELSKIVDLDVFDFSISKNKIDKAIYFLYFLFRNRNKDGFISLDTNTFLRITKLINFLMPCMLKNIKVITSGGIVDEIISSKNFDIKILNRYKKFLVETFGLKEKLEKIGIEKVDILPNCRLNPSDRKFNNLNEEKTIKIISISRICKEKGIIQIIEAEKLIKETFDFEIDFYGPIDNEIKNEFLEKISSRKRLKYLGIYEGDKTPIYDLLKKYHILLLPSSHNGEGYPGVIADSKIAGLAVIASNINYNNEIIRNEIDGIVMKRNNAKELFVNLTKLITQKEKLEKMRKNSYESAKKVLLENYLELLID